MNWKQILAFAAICTTVRGQFPNFLSALYGGLNPSTTAKPLVQRPPPPPPTPLRPRIDRQDDLTAPVINSIITAAPPSIPSNIPLSNPLLGNNNQNNYVVQNNNIGPNLGPSLTGSGGPSLGSLSGPGGVINTPSAFSSSPSVSTFIFMPLFLDCSWSIVLMAVLGYHYAQCTF